MARHRYPLWAGTFAIIAWLLSVEMPMSAQTFTGLISGSVVDPTGAAVPGASAKLRANKSGLVTQASTDDAGFFIFPGLDLGEYTLTVEKTGFNTLERKNVVLQAGERLALGRIPLTVGAVSEVVSVAAEAAVVQTENSARAGVITGKQVDNLLVIGRSVPALVGLLPGVVVTGETDALTRTGSFSTQGARANANNISVDGIQSTDIDNGTALKLQVSQDAVAEVQILLTNYQAEYGSGSGAVVNIATKSGTKQFHGLASYFMKNEFFDANDFFNNRNRIRRPRARTNTITYNIGGPVYLGKWNRNRDKLFFFWNHEFWPTKGSAATQVTMPTDLEKRGDFSQSLFPNGTLIPILDPQNNRQPFPGNVIPTSRLDPNGMALLRMFPQPNFLDRATSRGGYNYVAAARADTPNRLETLKLDYNISARDQVYGSFTTFHEVQQGWVLRNYFAPNWPQIPLRFKAATKGATVRYARTISPTVLNEAKFAWTGNPETLETSDEALNSILRKNAGFTAGQLNPDANREGILPAATFGGVPNAASMLGGSGWARYRAPRMFDPNNLYIMTDNLSVIRAQHAIKLGVQVQRFWRGIGPESFRFGSIDFGVNAVNPLDSNYAYANAALGNFNSYTETKADPYYWSRGGRIDWFAQDTWKVNSRLTLDYGMRFYYLIPAYDRDDAWGGFDPTRYDRSRQVRLIGPGRDAQGNRVGIHAVTGQTFPVAAIGAIAPGTGDPFNGMVSPSVDKSLHRGMYEQRGVQFGPRFGFSWDPAGQGKTAVRGGFGVFYNPLVIAQYRTFTNQPPRVEQPTLLFGQLSTLQSSPGLLFPGNVRGINFEGKVPTAMNFSLSVQQNIGFGTVVDIGYVGALGRHLYWARNLNPIPFGANFLSANQDPTTGRALAPNLLRPLPGYGNILFLEPASTSNYHSLQVTANRRFSRGLEFGASWTWSKALEFANGDASTVSALIPVRVWNYGLSANDRTHVVKISWLYALPPAPWQNVAAKRVLNDWQISGIASFISGAPVGMGFNTQPAVDITGSPSDGARADLRGSPVLPKSERTFSRNFRTDMAALPATGTFGNSNVFPLRGPGINNWDVAIFKNIPVHERAMFQFRWEMYNFFNHTQFATFDSTATFTPAGQQVNPAYGQYTSARFARRMQFALRFAF